MKKTIRSNLENESKIQKFWWLAFIPGVGIGYLYLKFYQYTRMKPPVYKKNVAEVEGLFLLTIILVAITGFACIMLFPNTSTPIPGTTSTITDILIALMCMLLIGFSIILIDYEMRK